MKKTPSTGSKGVFRKIALGAFLSALGCFGFFALVFSGIIRPSNKYLENFIEAPIPEDATHIRATFHVIPSTDIWHSIRFELPPDKLEGFLDELCFSEEELSSDYPTSNSQMVPWWRPDDATKHVGGKCIDWDTGKFYSIIIDQSNPDSYIIYLAVSCC